MSAALTGGCIATGPARPGRTRARLAGFGSDEVAPGVPAQGGIQDQEGVRCLAGKKIDIGSQVRQEPAIRVVGIDHDGVSDDILGHGGVEANFVDGAVKDAVWKGVHGEVNFLAVKGSVLTF